MAEQNFTTEEAGVVWDTLGSTDTGRPLKVNRRSLVMSAVQVTGPGVFGGTVTLQGSLDGVNWALLRDTRGLPCEWTSPNLVEMSSAVTYVRPVAAFGVSGVTVRIALGGP
jgi:hypothetical protein